MPSYLHEALVEMFRNQPALAAELLAGPLGVDVPPFDHAGVTSGDLTDVTPTEYRADVAVTLNKDDTAVFAVVVEAQLTTAPYRYQSDFARRYFAKGEAQAVLSVLEARDLPVAEAVRERILRCSDADQLEIWLRRAVTVRKAEDLFA